MPDPKKCLVVIDDMGSVGFRIEDSRQVTETIMKAMRTRVGRDGVMYEGAEKNAQQLQKMLGAGVEVPVIQQEKLDYFKAATANAAWRIKAKFGTDKKAPKDKRAWITVACRKKDRDVVSPTVDEKRVEAKSFAESVTALAAALPAFCPDIPKVDAKADAAPAPDGTVIPIEGATNPDGTPLTPPAEPPGMSHKKETKPWKPPPPR